MPAEGPQRDHEATDVEQPDSLTLVDALKQAVQEADGNPELSAEERELLTTLESRYERDRLKVTLDTRQEIMSFRDGIDAIVADMQLAEGELERLDQLVKKTERVEGIEDHLNGLEGVETIRDLSELPVEKLIELEDAHEGVLLLAFTDFKDKGDAIDLSRFADFYQAPTKRTTLTINFRNNPDAESRLGAADIFPPSIRKISVLEGGSAAFTRTSERRIGLKGQNRPGNGFFDNDGYMQIYSGDEVVIGGVDQEFEKKYRKEDGTLNYEQYKTDHGAADQHFLTTELSPSARLSKYHEGSSLDRRSRRQVELWGRSSRVDKMIQRNPDLYRYAHNAREFYRGKTGIDIDENIMFGVAQIESGFGVTRMNDQGSGAGGMFQFIPKTWNSFLKANPWVYEKMEADPKWSQVDQMDWRFNPEIMMYAGYWLATANMETLYARKDQIQQSEFRDSEFYRSGKVTIEDAWLLYLPHHDGVEGTIKLLKYQALREQGVGARAAEQQIGLERFQKHSHTFEKGKTIYNYDSFIADQHWTNIRAYAQRNVDWAQTYSEQLDDVDLDAVLAESEGSWGWE
jgi:hypothetical protein